jgi:hypothetical protein
MKRWALQSLREQHRPAQMQPIQTEQSRKEQLANRISQRAFSPSRNRRNHHTEFTRTPVFTGAECHPAHGPAI